jgi:hypothetical protein
MKYRMKSDLVLVSPMRIHVGVDGIVSQSADLRVDDVFIIINRKNNTYCAVRAIPDVDIKNIDVDCLCSNFIEPIETEEQAKQRRAIEHLQSAASELGYDLVKK